MSSILPYRVDFWPAPRQASHPPTVEMSIDWGKWPSVMPTRAQLLLEWCAERAAAHTSRSSDCSSTSTMPSTTVRSSTTPPCTGTLAPHTPLRPAATVTGTRASLQIASISATCAVSWGVATNAASGCSVPSACHTIASGHQSRLASPSGRAPR